MTKIQLKRVNHKLSRWTFRLQRPLEKFDSAFSRKKKKKKKGKLRRKIGHAHDNSTDSENVAGAPQPNVHAHFIFRFENCPGNQGFFSIYDQNTAETSQPQAQPMDDWRAMERACPRGLQRPLEKFDSAWLSRKKKKKKKKASSVNRRKFLLRGYKFKETKHDRFGKTATEAEKMNDRSTEAGVNTYRRSIGQFFFLFSTIV